MANSWQWVALHICERQSHYILSHDQQFVSDIFSENQSHCILYSLWVTLHMFRKPITFIACPATNSLRMWVTMTVTSLNNFLKANHITCCPGSEWLTLQYSPSKYHDILIYQSQEVSVIHQFSDRKSHGTLSHDQQFVSNIEHFSESQSHHMLSYDQQEVSDTHCTSSPSKSHHILCYQSQEVSDIQHFLTWQKIPWHLVPWPTVCEWHCTFFSRQISSHLALWPTGSEWQCTFFWKPI